MKNRRLAIVTFMLVAILLLGVGYAAVSRQLQISGTAHISAVTLSEFDVTFTEATSQTPTDFNGNGTVPTASTNTIEPGKHEVTLTVGNFETVGDKLVLEYKVTYSTVKKGIHAHLSTPSIVITNTTNSADETKYFSASAVFAASNLTEEAPTTTLTLTINLDAVPTEATFFSITVTFSAEPVTGTVHA